MHNHISKATKKINFYINQFFRRRGHGISLLVPFYSSDPENQRAKNWQWLYNFWKVQLPGAEIIIGHDKDAGKFGMAFSKSVAVNNAASRAHGDIFVIIDADGYIDPKAILYCAKEIRWAKKKERKLWFIPYRQFFRLTENASQKLLDSKPKHPYYFPTPPDKNDYIETSDFKGTSGSKFGHWYGALIQIMSREAFEEVGGWDPRFRGWGGEDHAAMRAMDTLYWPHKTLPGKVLHIWHPILAVPEKYGPANKTRRWENQGVDITNDMLSGRYYYSQGHALRMRKLLDEVPNRIHK